MEGKTILDVTNVCFETIECYTCHILFAVSKEHRSSLLKTHETFYCPSGHPQHYVSKTNADRWREYADSVEKQLENCRSEGNELYDEIQELQVKKRELQKTNRYLKKMKTQYKNKLTQQE